MLEKRRDRFVETGTGEQLAALLDEIARILAGVDTSKALLASVEDACMQLEHGRVYLAVVGQFKRGKSTIINALLGDKILPTSVLPTTAIPTFVTGGSEDVRVCVIYRDGKVKEEVVRDRSEVSAALEALVTECGNPENRKAVERVEIACRSEILDQGVVIVDTPGIGSTFEHNTKTTLDFLPKCDVALFVVSADPPITEAELSFLSDVEKRAGRMFFALNKSDYLNDYELEQALHFLEQVLIQKAGLVPPVEVFPVSAKQALAAKRDNDPNALERSGFTCLEHRLMEFARRELQEILIKGVKRKALDAVERALMDMRLSLRSLQMPLESLDEKADLFARKLEEIKFRRTRLGDSVEGEKKRCRNFIESLARGLMERSVSAMMEMLNSVLSAEDDTVADESKVEQAFASGVPALFQSELEALGLEASSYVEGSLAELQRDASELVLDVRRAAAEVFDIPFKVVPASEMFRLDTRVYWESKKWNPSFSPVPQGAIDKLLPAGARRRRLEKRWKHQVQQLAMQNTETVRWQLIQSSIKAFAQFADRLDASMAEALDGTWNAVQAARNLRKERADECNEEISRLQGLIGSLQETARSLQALELD